MVNQASWLAATGSTGLVVSDGHARDATMRFFWQGESTLPSRDTGRQGMWTWRIWALPSKDIGKSGTKLSVQKGSQGALARKQSAARLTNVDWDWVVCS